MASSQAWKKKAKKYSRTKHESEQQLDSLPWNPSLTESDDPFSLLAGSNQLEGGFLSLEEIDESEYALEIPQHNQIENLNPIKQNNNKRKLPEDVVPANQVEDKEKLKQSKEKKKDSKNKVKSSKDSLPVTNAEDGKLQEVVVPANQVEDKVKDKKQLKQSTNKNKSNKKKIKTPQDTLTVTNGEDVIEDDSVCVDEDEYNAWNELRLHPLLMKSIYRLKFKEPTPIQKACIPAAAHQGKDVIGAAETGSGKTLAFGLPILQRLLQEQEKSDSRLTENGEADEKIAPRGLLRALIITPTRELALQVTDHLKQIVKDINIKVVPIVGGMSSEKQERLLRARPEIVVGTPGRLWELMSGGQIHLVEQHSLSFFVLDEADRMIENGHFQELQSIIDMLPGTSTSTDNHSSNTENCVTVSSIQRKKRQTLVFSATIALSSDFRKKLKRGSLKSKPNDELNSIEALSERAGMRANAAIVDLTNASIMTDRLEESFIECREEDKDAFLYYILSVHGQGRTIVFCTSIAALRHLSSLLRILGVTVWTLHAQMQQRARLKAIDRFRGNDDGILVATDVAARGLDIPNVRTVIHYQLPHSAEVYVHRSGRTARASADGCSIALISSNDTSKFAALCKSFSKKSFQQFPVDSSYMPWISKRLSLARQIDKISRKDSQEKANRSWFERNAESIELVLEDNDSDDEKANSHKRKKANSIHLKKLQQELNLLLSKPLQPKTFSHRYLAGAGISPELQHQFEELAKQRSGDAEKSTESKRRKLVVIGQECVEPLQALRSGGHEVNMDLKEVAEKRRNLDNLKRKRKDEKKRLHDQKRKQKKILKGGN